MFQVQYYITLAFSMSSLFQVYVFSPHVISLFSTSMFHQYINNLQHPSFENTVSLNRCIFFQQPLNFYTSKQNSTILYICFSSTTHSLFYLLQYGLWTSYSTEISFVDMINNLLLNNSSRHFHTCLRQSLIMFCTWPLNSSLVPWWFPLFFCFYFILLSFSVCICCLLLWGIL